MSSNFILQDSTSAINNPEQTHENFANKPSVEISLTVFVNKVVEAKLSSLLENDAIISVIKSKLNLSEPEDELLNTEQAYAFLHISRGTLNTRILRGEIIPETPKSGKRNLFSKKHLRESIGQKHKPKAI